MLARVRPLGVWYRWVSGMRPAGHRPGGALGNRPTGLLGEEARGVGHGPLDDVGVPGSSVPPSRPSWRPR